MAETNKKIPQIPTDLGMLTSQFHTNGCSELYVGQSGRFLAR